MAVVRLNSLPELQRALIKMGTKMEAELMPQAMRNAARFGATAVIRTSATTKPRPKASGTYERSWVVNRISGGAVLSNTAAHSIFVEKGRLPGRAPPLNAIVEWVYQKRIVSRSQAFNQVYHQHAKYERARARQIAILIQRKIAKKGTPGRFILRTTMPQIAKRANYETRLAVRKITSNPPK